MTQTLYNLRTSDLGYRITKFTDGEVESSYLTSDQACDCPAGHRVSCRHRQMLPQMLVRHLANSDLFWDFDRGFSCDINGNAKRETVACAPAEQDTECRTCDEDDVEIFEPNASYSDGTLILAGVNARDVSPVPAGPHVKEDEYLKGIRERWPAGQHTAAEGLPPEQTVLRDLAKQRLHAENYQIKPWRRL